MSGRCAVQGLAPRHPRVEVPLSRRHPVFAAAPFRAVVTCLWVAGWRGVCGWWWVLGAFYGFAQGSRDPWVARVRGPLCRVRAAGVWADGRVYGHGQDQKRQSRAEATVKGDSQGRQSRATVKGDSQGRLRRRLRGERPRSGEWGPRWLPADVACGRLCPGFPVASSPGGNHPGLGGVKPDRCYWPPVSSGWTPPSPGWLCKHRRSDGESGTTPACGVDSVHSATHGSTGVV
ncbi:hypothetical protein ABIA31_001765 [Catenulispora sp. MAP5-51]